MSGLTPDQKANALFAAQYGVISVEQALACGFNHQRARYRVERGSWARPAPRAFVAAAVPPTWQQAVMVACLAGPAGTVASHLIAAALLECLPPPGVPHVTVPCRQRWSSGLAVVHHAPLAAEDLTTVAGVPSTSVERTLADCAALLSTPALCDLVDDALFKHLSTAPAVEAAVARLSQAPGRKGLPALLATLEPWAPGPHPGSQAEMRMIRRVQARGFPLPQRQWKLYADDGEFVARLDAAWPERKAGLEYFGARHHGPRQEEHDRKRLKRVKDELGWDVRIVRASDLRGGLPNLLRWLERRL